MTAKAVDGREETCVEKLGSSVMSVMVDMVSIEGKEIQGTEPSAQKVVVADRDLVDDSLLDDGDWVHK